MVQVRRGRFGIDGFRTPVTTYKLVDLEIGGSGVYQLFTSYAMGHGIASQNTQLVGLTTAW